MASGIWEQDEVKRDIPVYKVNFYTKGSEIILQARGDTHIGLNCVDVNEMINELKKSQNKYKNNMFVIDTGDMLENALKKSIGHNYDVGIPDPTEQMKLALKAQEELDINLYGKDTYNKMKPCTRKNTKHARRIGVLGNHEYRTRKESGIWLNRELYSGKGVIDGGIHGIVELTVINKKIKLRKTYKIYIAHRLTNSSAGISHATIMKNFNKKKSDIAADIYICGHYHRRFIAPDYKYTSKGEKKKVLYVCNPSPADVTEYGLWGLYSPIGAGYYTNIHLPIDGNAWGKI